MGVKSLTLAVDKNMNPEQIAALPEFAALDKADAIFDADTPLKTWMPKTVERCGIQ